MPIIGEQDEFEGLYTEKFRGLARPYGEFVNYERDRAAIDIGLHLTDAAKDSYKRPTNARIWVQLKGIRSSTISLEEFNKLDEVTLNLKIDHLRFWYASPEAVYLVVYIEAVDIFLAEDIRIIVDNNWGEKIFLEETFLPGQKTTQTRVSTKSVLNDASWQQMLNHRSIRIDGPLFRGRPLGHRLDPLRCIPAKMDPSVFAELVSRLLAVHGFKHIKKVDLVSCFPDSDQSDEYVNLSVGILKYTYEWVPQLFTEFGYDPRDDFQIEGEISFVQGKVAVLTHYKTDKFPNRDFFDEIMIKLKEQGEIKKLLVFVNDNDDASFGYYFHKRQSDGIECTPQLLGDLAFNILTATTVYLEFRDRIKWDWINYLY